MKEEAVVHGVGTLVLYDFTTGREIARMKRMESGGITQGTTMKNVSGGDALDPFDSFQTDRTITWTFVNNAFNAGMLELPTGKRAIPTLSCPFIKYDEGAIVPSTGPYTATVKYATTSQDGSVRVRFNDTREDFAPKPAFAASALSQSATATFDDGRTVSVRIAAVVKGIESIGSTVRTIVINNPGSQAGVNVTVPLTCLTPDTSMPGYDVDLDGFNIYAAVNDSSWTIAISVKVTAITLLHSGVWPPNDTYYLKVVDTALGYKVQVYLETGRTTLLAETAVITAYGAVTGQALVAVGGSGYTGTVSASVAAWGLHAFALTVGGSPETALTNFVMLQDGHFPTLNSSGLYYGTIDDGTTTVQVKIYSNSGRTTQIAESPIYPLGAAISGMLYEVDDSGFNGSFTLNWPTTTTDENFVITDANPTGGSIEATGVITAAVGVEYLANIAPVARGTVVDLPATGTTASPATTPTTTGQFSFSAGTITFAAADAGKQVLIDYIWTTSATVYQAEQIDVLESCLRNYVRGMWVIESRSESGHLKEWQWEVFKAKYTGDFTMDFKRADASTHTFNFTIFNPGRSDGKIIGFKVADLGVAEPCD